MIDSDLLRQLGWSNDLINEVTRVAEPMRRTIDQINFGSSITTLNYSAGSSVYVDQGRHFASQAINPKAKR